MVVLKRAGGRRPRRRPRLRRASAGVGVASDGRATGVMAPRVEGEELALRRAYDGGRRRSRARVGLIEAHGTGTAVGDATEIEALTRVFGERDGELPARARSARSSR